MTKQFETGDRVRVTETIPGNMAHGAVPEGMTGTITASPFQLPPEGEYAPEDYEDGEYLVRFELDQAFTPEWENALCILPEYLEAMPEDSAPAGPTLSAEETLRFQSWKEGAGIPDPERTPNDLLRTEDLPYAERDWVENFVYQIHKRHFRAHSPSISMLAEWLDEIADTIHTGLRTHEVEHDRRTERVLSSLCAFIAVQMPPVKRREVKA